MQECILIRSKMRVRWFGDTTYIFIAISCKSCVPVNTLRFKRHRLCNASKGFANNTTKPEHKQARLCADKCVRRRRTSHHITLKARAYTSIPTGDGGDRCCCWSAVFNGTHTHTQTQIFTHIRASHALCTYVRVLV